MTAAANPQQQAEYDSFVKNGMRLIYGNKKGLKQLLKSLDGSGDPMDGLANTLTAIALRVTDSAKKAGKTLPPEVVMYGAGELLEQLADFSAQSGGHKYGDEELQTIAQKMVDGLKGSPAEAGAAPATPPQPPELMPRTA